MKNHVLQEYKQILATLRAGHPPRVSLSIESTRQTPRVTVRAFDDGAPIRSNSLSVAASGTSGEYDLGITAPAGMAEYELGASFEAFSEYEVGPGVRDQPPEQGSPREPAVLPTASQASRSLDRGERTSPPVGGSDSPRAQIVPSSDSASGHGRAAAQSAFSYRQLQDVIRDKELLADIQSVLGKKGESEKADAPSPLAALASSTPQPQIRPEPPQPPQPNEHAIFDKIAENMRFATAYDLGTVELMQRLNSFDEMEASRRSLPTVKHQAPSPRTGEASTSGAPAIVRAELPPAQREPVSIGSREESESSNS